MYDFKKTSLPFMILCFSLLLLTSPQLARAQAERAAKGVKQSFSPESTNCPTSQTFTFGSGTNYFSFCITDTGNIINFRSPSTSRHIFHTEGYLACATGANSAFDAGLDGMEGWGTATATQPGGPKTLPLTIKRQSTDGKLELTQTFNWDTARKEVIVTMALKNISAGSLSAVKLVRYFDADLDTTSSISDGTDDIYDLDSDSVFGFRLGA